MEQKVNLKSIPDDLTVDCGAFSAMQKHFRKQWWLWFGGTVVVVAGLGTALAATGNGLWNILLVLAGIALPIVLSFRFSKQLTAYYKAEIVPQLVGQFCDDGTYSPKAGISENAFCACNLFGDYDRYRTEDLIEGQIGQTKFCAAEVHAMKRYTNGSKTQWVDVFRGIFFVADFNKEFNGQTTMVPSSRIAKALASSATIKLENPELMKAFLVFSTDETEARYILTPGLMERIMRLWSKYRKQVNISFTGSSVIVARSFGIDCYEAGIWNSLGLTLRRDMSAIRNTTALVEDLDMNTRIWTKE